MVVLEVLLHLQVSLGQLWMLGLKHVVFYVFLANSVLIYSIYFTLSTENITEHKE